MVQSLLSIPVSVRKKSLGVAYLEAWLVFNSGRGEYDPTNLTSCLIAEGEVREVVKKGSANRIHTR